jgi:hypothetical protein
MSDGVYRALLIGNSTFPEDPHNLFDLNGPVNDIALLREALVDAMEKTLQEAGVPEEQIRPERLSGY